MQRNLKCKGIKNAKALKMQRSLPPTVCHREHSCPESASYWVQPPTLSDKLSSKGRYGQIREGGFGAEDGRRTEDREQPVFESIVIIRRKINYALDCSGLEAFDYRNCTAGQQLGIPVGVLDCSRWKLAAGFSWRWFTRIFIGAP